MMVAARHNPSQSASPVDHGHVDHEPVDDDPEPSSLDGSHPHTQSDARSDNPPNIWLGSDSLDLDCLGAHPDWAPDMDDLTAIAQRVLDHIGIAPCTAEVSLQWVDDGAMADLNGTYRGKQSPTNVLSFPAYDPDDLDAAVMLSRAGGPPLHFGDIAMAPDVCLREAAEQSKPVRDHGIHLFVHGLLHLLGYDHIDDDDAEIMEGHEIALLAAMKIANPYSDTHSITDKETDHG